MLDMPWRTKRNKKYASFFFNFHTLPLLFVFFMWLLTACQPALLTADTLPWVSDMPILFADDFTAETGGWKTLDDRISFAGYVVDGFRLWVDLPNYLIWSTPGLNFQNVSVHTSVEKISGPENNLFGVTCRHQDSDNYYAFLISSDGYYGIFKNLSGRRELVDSQEMLHSSIINQEGGLNKIQAICQDDKLILIVNDTQLLQVVDDSLSFGDVGMIAGNLSDSGSDILFNYFIISKP